MAHQFFVLELVEAETIAALPTVVVILDVGNHTRTHLQLHVLGRCVALLVLVHRLEVLAYHRAMGYHVGSEVECDERDEHARNHVGAHQAAERHARGENGDDLGIAGQLRREENHGNKDEQRRE